MKMKHFVSAVVVAIFSAASAETASEHGAHLVRGMMGCGNCSRPFEQNGFDKAPEFAGRLADGIERVTACYPNFTPAELVAQCSNTELAHAFREKTRPGVSLFWPPMPCSGHQVLSGEPVAAVMAFRRSLVSVVNAAPISGYRHARSAACGRLVESVTIPEMDVPRGHGAYRALAVDFFVERASPTILMEPDYENTLGKDGFEIHGSWGVSVSSHPRDHTVGLAGKKQAEAKGANTHGARTIGLPMSSRGTLRTAFGDKQRGFGVRCSPAAFAAAFA